MEEKSKNPMGEKYADNFEETVNGRSESKFSLGLLVLIGGCIWAILELIDSVLFFF